MIKLIDKKDCTFKNNYIIHDDSIVIMPYPVVHELNQLERLYQQAMYVSNQPDGVSAPNLKGFEFESVIKGDLPELVPDTPTLDAKVKETLAFLDDLETKEFCRKVNFLVGKFETLFRFVKAPFIKDTDCGYTDEFDLKYIGSPLLLTEARIMDLLEFIVHQDERCNWAIDDSEGAF